MLLGLVWSCYRRHPFGKKTLVLRKEPFNISPNLCYPPFLHNTEWSNTIRWYYPPNHHIGRKSCYFWVGCSLEKICRLSPQLCSVDIKTYSNLFFWKFRQKSGLRCICASVIIRIFLGFLNSKPYLSLKWFLDSL